jgi:hypothetical protein
MYNSVWFSMHTRLYNDYLCLVQKYLYYFKEKHTLKQLPSILSCHSATQPAFCLCRFIWFLYFVCIESYIWPFVFGFFHLTCLQSSWCCVNHYIISFYACILVHCIASLLVYSFINWWMFVMLHLLEIGNSTGNIYVKVLFEHVFNSFGIHLGMGFLRYLPIWCTNFFGMFPMMMSPIYNPTSRSNV